MDAQGLALISLSLTDRQSETDRSPAFEGRKVLHILAHFASRLLLPKSAFFFSTSLPRKRVLHQRQAFYRFLHDVFTIGVTPDPPS